MIITIFYLPEIKISYATIPQRQSFGLTNPGRDPKPGMQEAALEKIETSSYEQWIIKPTKIEKPILCIARNIVKKGSRAVSGLNWWTMLLEWHALTAKHQAYAQIANES
jgi:hypothetical protein